MNYLTSHTRTQYPFLVSTARKKTTKHRLIYIEQGNIIVRLGKEEYIFTTGQTLWLPIDCLVAISYLPNTNVTEIEISIRSQRNYPYQAGLLRGSELINAIVNKLCHLHFSPNDTALKALYSVFIDEITSNEYQKEKTPHLNDNHTSVLQSFKDKTEHHQIQVALKVREAFKMQQSGKHRSVIINTLFSGNEAQADQLCRLIANQAL
ncbi:hypothetical protein HC725_09680 [Vibrio sp. S17_S38]|uniref:hypothetical protein n=1 Tax=Vibrio sp. S17_S38 TaxID=2720229 RepID=UPI00168038DF|nr:hypothetical protein [Vibrio sp. S17_S38]MBD1573545.1 hypothetical protein [Vibrio sp. S17_S38]